MAKKKVNGKAASKKAEAAKPDNVDASKADVKDDAAEQAEAAKQAESVEAVLRAKIAAAEAQAEAEAKAAAEAAKKLVPSMEQAQFKSAIIIAKRLQSGRSGCSIELLLARTGYDISEADYALIMKELK